jgi:hypothetical protein
MTVWTERKPMKAVDIGFGAVAFEPDSDADRIGALDIERLRRQGVSDQVIAMYVDYRNRYHCDNSDDQGESA